MRWQNLHKQPDASEPLAADPMSIRALKDISFGSMVSQLYRQPSNCTKVRTYSQILDASARWNAPTDRLMPV
ncbi:uncharacterized protein C8Q71DRAFT_106520 [Rhodofomes roseus]|uniref:Uncharacterized protein n=1 Tax=Rhodofomes roseus TaxID=34475 RepID=A0ABQ8KCA1_9APHY|nr:uncharacterized protein C8Q71DRAFT_106520 [Rhodofomes roseus]KAH9835152.1 hypothetical protein C8Q71DRAFT_106520 [Rhodofomes roseus]